MNRKHSLFFLFLIILVAIITRFYKLGDAPAGLYLDEAAQGYNAYSILRTGRDEFGKMFPVVFRSFTDFKTPVYIYLVVPLIPLFDLTKFTVRFPSFFFSILTIPILYLLVEKLLSYELGVLSSKLTHNTLTRNRITALTACLLLAISPWHILFGRTNFECNVALFFLLSGIFYFYRGLEKPNELLISALLFAIAIPAYHAQRIVTPFIMLALFVRHQKTLLLKSHKKYLIIGGLIGFAILIPTLNVALTPGFLARASLNIISHSKQLPAGSLEWYRGFFNPLVNGSWFLTTKEFLALYVSYFAPRNIFILGDSGPRSSFPYLSTFFLWQFPFYLIGFYSLVKVKISKEYRFFTFSLLLISPIPAALTRDPYSTIRSLQMVIPLVLITAYGLVRFYEYCKRILSNNRLISQRLFNFAFVIAGITTVSYSLLKLYSSVVILNEYYRPVEWNWGFEEVARTIKTLDPLVPIVVDNARTEPYSQLLFFLKFDPSAYQKKNFEVPSNEYYTNMNRNKTKIIGNITTRPINWKEDLLTENYLIGDSLAISDEQIEKNNLTLIKKVFYPDTSVAFVIAKTNTGD